MHQSQKEVVVKMEDHKEVVINTKNKIVILIDYFLKRLRYKSEAFYFFKF